MDEYYKYGIVGTAIVVIVVATYAFKISSRDESKWPPIAPGGMLKTIKVLSGNDYPWFMLRTAKKLKSNVFRLSLPIPGCPIVVVGEVDSVRAVLSDPLTEKRK